MARYKAGSGAKAVAGYGSATRDVAETTNMWKGIESLWRSGEDVAAAFSLSKGEADTAWSEYEAGYKALGGDPADIPKRDGFFKQLGRTLLPGGDKGFFQKPEGEVRIGARMYDRAKIRKAGGILGSATGQLIEEDKHKGIAERFASGRDMTSEEISTTRESLRPKTPYKESYDVDEEFGYDAWTAESPVYQPGQEPELSTVGKDWETPMQYGQDEPMQESKHGGVDPNPRGKSLWSKIKEGFKEAEKYGDQTDWSKVKKGWGDFFYKATPENWEEPVDPHPKSLITGKYYSPYKNLQQTYEDQ